MEDSLTVIESLCPRCEENGETRLLPHRIPYFRTILVSSFSCGHCGHTNNAVEPVSEIQPFGERITLQARLVGDLNRQVVKSEHASVRIPELDFEIPRTKGGSGLSSTVQGIVLHAAQDLEESQPARYLSDAETARQVADFIVRLKALVEAPAGAAAEAALPTPFSFIVTDASGNSFVENPSAPSKDPQLEIAKFERSLEQLHEMGYYEEQSDVRPAKVGADLPETKQTHQVWDLNQAMSETGGAALDATSAVFVMPCAHCGKDGAQNMCEIDVPGFRKCWVMAFVCDFCGARSNEVKPAGSYGAQGRKWVLTISGEEDLNRDVLKSDTAAVRFPALELELEYGTLGGVFTTVEGLLLRIANEIDEKMPFHGDSQLPERRERLAHIVGELKAAAAGERVPFEMVLDDMADLSHVGRRGDELLFLTEKARQTRGGVVGETASLDQQLRSESYERSPDQNEQLGLADMKTENYET